MARHESVPLLFDLPLKPDFSIESRLLKSGILTVAGTDEAGRGPIAGPVVAAAVILDGDNLPVRLDDSKRMTKTAREKAFDSILSKARAVALCSMSAEDIDAKDIRKASLEAMRRAVAALSVAAEHVLADGRDIPPGLACTATALVKGDQRSLSVAAASIIAKVTRDQMMEQAGTVHPCYGFENHAGYGTSIHSKAIAGHGPIQRLHRYTFAPIRKA